MKHINLPIDIEVYTMEELSQVEQQLLKAAIDATQTAYAKYSHFRVGAALLLNDGRTVIGANQENAAYPSGLCAERSAIFAAQSQFPDQPIRTLAVAARNTEGHLLANPISPCGACRQVVLEIEDRYRQPVRILLYGTNAIYALNSMKDLLPLSFVDECMHP